MYDAKGMIIQEIPNLFYNKRWNEMGVNSTLSYLDDILVSNAPLLQKMLSKILCTAFVQDFLSNCLIVVFLCPSYFVS